MDHLGREFGAACQERYKTIFEDLRTELGYADYLGALQRYRAENLHDPRIPLVSSFLLEYPFGARLYPGALDVLAHLDAFGPTVILSDGDVVFQPRKIERSGLAAAVEGRVLIYVHKERELDDVAAKYPARHYVLVDDKLRILAAVKGILGDQVSTLHVAQGHYASSERGTFPAADLEVPSIAAVRKLGREAFLGGGR
jgi:hypothetical protein